MKTSKLILPVIVISQFCCTSLWFAGNGVINDLVINFGLNESALGHLTSAVQFGFIIGTLTFAILTISDRFSPSKVFLISALLGALFNLGILWESNNLLTLLLLRFFTGFFLAGIYPVGMKIATDYFKNGLGKSLGFLVGALVIGTAFPHLLNGITEFYSWKSVLITTSLLATLGGLLMFLIVPNGPYRKPSQQTDFSAFLKVFENKKFRSAAFGYFGHMWELYAFWAFTPLAIQTYNLLNSETLSIPIWTGIIIALGGLSCVLGGLLSQKTGSHKIALVALFLSGVFCLVSPILFQLSTNLFLIGWCFWGMAVTADSPQFSNLVASSIPAELKGTGLTLVNCIGFAISIVSIQLLSYLAETTNPKYLFILLSIGPLLGLLSLGRKAS